VRGAQFTPGGFHFTTRARCSMIEKAAFFDCTCVSRAAASAISNPLSQVL